MKLVRKWFDLTLALTIGIVALTVQVQAEEKDDWVSEVKMLIEEKNNQEVLSVDNDSLTYDSKKDLLSIDYIARDEKREGTFTFHLNEVKNDSLKKLVSEAKEKYQQRKKIILATIIITIIALIIVAIISPQIFGLFIEAMSTL